MAGRSPTQSSLAKMRDEGYMTAIVEHWNSFVKVRQDMYGILDLVGVKEGATLGCQCTSYSNMSARVKKIKDSEATPRLLAAGWLIEVHGWRKVNNRWECRVVTITAEDL